MQRAALFDMDRTLVQVNTAGLYVRWQFRNGEARARDLAQMLWWLAQYTMGVVDAEAIARHAALGLRGQGEADVSDKLRRFVKNEVMQHVAAAARNEVTRMRERGYLCAILTSSTSYSALPLGEELGIEHILGSRLLVADGRFTGEYGSPLCYGPGKIAAAEQWASEHAIDLRESVFYTDSISDLPMLERVGTPVAINPDPRLWLLARRRGWRTEKW